MKKILAHTRRSVGSGRIGVLCALRFAAALIPSIACAPAGAAENGNAHYPTGTNTIVPALMPPPGNSVWLNYITYYTADRFNNSNGDSSIPGYKISAYAESARLLHTWTAIDGISLTSGIVIVANHVDLHVPNRSDSGGSLGDFVVQPLFLTKAYGDLHLMAGFDVSLPTGPYDKSHLVNPGLNYATLAPQLSLTWLPTKEFELSLFSVFGINAKNDATQYKSGKYFDIDYSIGYRPIPSMPMIETSLIGYYFTQFTDDEVNGKRFLDGHRGRAFAVGPQIRYQFARGGITLKWMHETEVRNRPEGERFQLQFAVPF